MRFALAILIAIGASPVWASGGSSSVNEARHCYRRIFGWYIPTMPTRLSEDGCQAMQIDETGNEFRVDLYHQGYTVMAKYCRGYGASFVPSSAGLACLKDFGAIETSGVGNSINSIYVEGVCLGPIPGNPACTQVQSYNLGAFQD